MRVNRYLLFGIVLSIISPKASYAITNLKQIHLRNDREIKLVFDQRVKKDEVTLDFINEIVQLSIQHVSIYPAKIIPLNGKLVKKVFAYQYSPQVIRCRLSLGEKVEKYRNHVHLIYAGKNLLVRFDDISNSQRQEAKAQAEKAEKTEKIEKSEKAEKTEKAEVQVSEAELLNKVLQGGKAAQHNSEVSTGFEKHAQQHTVRKNDGMWAILKTLGALGVLGLVVMFVTKKRKFLTPLTQFVEKNLKKDKKLIQVVGKYYLEPKKSLVLVRVGGRLLLLGSSHESISLITEMPEGVRPEKEEKEVIEPEVSDQIFAQFLNSEEEKPAFSGSNVRSRIRNRLEGLKPL